MIFGDIEPDSVSLEPRNERVWESAAPKVATGTLRAIFIECSYTDSVEDNSLYGHLCPRHLVTELAVLANKVRDSQKSQKRDSESRKRKRRASVADGEPSEPVSPKSTAQKRPTATTGKGQMKTRAKSSPAVGEESGNEPSRPGAEDSDRSSEESARNSGQASALPLQGLRVYIIHVKESLTDTGTPREKILEELRAHADSHRLGCEFYAPLSGEGAYI